MTKDEALKIAIEAMESAELVWASAGIVKMHEAIEACKYALDKKWENLDEEEFEYFCSWVNHRILCEIEKTLKDKNA